MALADRIVSIESGGDPNARNPRSSATGAGQFIDATWLEMLSKHRPELTTGKSREEILALRSDPSLSKQMTEAYASDNAGILGGAGLPVTPGTTYLAHFAGPQGALGILKADPSAPAGSILGAGVVKANPFLARMTAGDLTKWAETKMGGATNSAPQMPRPTPQPQQQPMGRMPGIPSSPQAPAQSSGGFFASIPAEQPMQLQAPPIIPQRRQVDLSRLRAAFSQPRPLSRGFY